MRKYVFVILSVVIISGLVISGLIFGSCSEPATTTAPAAKTSAPATTTTAPAATTSAPAKTTSPVTTSSPAAPGIQTQTGGTLRVIINSTTRNIGDPGSTGINGRSLFVEPLTLFDTKGNLIPWLAESWDLNPTAKTMTFKLKRGVKFHDGTDFNAAAVKWNWEQQSAIGRITGSADLKSMEVVDDYTIKLTFNRFSALYIFAYTHSIPMFSPTAVQKNGKDWARTHAVGTGPFKQADFKPDSYFKLVRYDGYWSTKPYLDGIDQTVVSDATVAGLTMRKKDADMWDSANLMEGMQLKDEGYQVIQRRAMINFLAMDSGNPKSIFSNIKVRQAVEYAIDRNALAAVRGFGGAYEPIFQFATPTDKGYNPNIAVRNYDPQKTRQLLAEAGYPDGIKTKMICANDQTTIDTCTLLQAYLRAAGITVELDPADTARRQSMVAPGGTGWTDALVYGGVGVNAGLDYVRWTIANTFTTQPKGWYSSVIKTPAFSTLYDQMVTVPSLEEAEAIGMKMVKQIYDDVMVIPLFNSPYTLVAQKYVHTNFLSVHHMIWNPELDWMEKH